MEAGLDNANATNNPFANSNGTEILQQKDGFLLNLTEGLKQNGAELSPSNEYAFDRPANGKRSAEEFDEDEDMGPETDVDAIDEALLSPMMDQNVIDNKNIAGFDPFTTEIEEKATLEMDLDIQKQQTSEFEPPRTPREETPTPPADEVHDAGVEENVADSGEDSEDEWNYYKGDTAESEKVSSSKADQEVAELTKTVEEDEDAAMSQLNPNAAEFVPISSPTRNVVSPACRTLINDEVIAQSPRRATPSDIDINLPNPQDFEKEVKNRPSDVYSNGQDNDAKKLSSQEVMENLLNGRNIEDIEFHPGTPHKASNTEEFHFGPNATPFSTPAKLLDQSEAALSTRAVFGDESSYLESKTLGLECSFTTEDSSNANPFNTCDDVCDFQKQLSKPADPMAMSFYQDESETNPFDLNKVQMLPDSDEFVDKQDNGGQFDDTISDLPEHDPLAENERIITDLDRPTEASDVNLICGVSKLPETPEPTLQADEVSDNILTCDFPPAKSPILMEAAQAPLPLTPEPNSDELQVISAPKTPDAISPLLQENVLFDSNDSYSPVSPTPSKSPVLKTEDLAACIELANSGDLIVESSVATWKEHPISPTTLSPEPTELQELATCPEPTDNELCQVVSNRPDSKPPLIHTPEPTEEFLCQNKSPEPTDLSKSPVPTREPELIEEEKRIEENLVIHQTPSDKKDTVEEIQEVIKEEEFFPICQKPIEQNNTIQDIVKEEEFFPICSKPANLSAMEDICHEIISQKPAKDDLKECELSKSPVPPIDNFHVQSEPSDSMEFYSTCTLATTEERAGVRPQYDELIKSAMYTTDEELGFDKIREEFFGTDIQEKSPESEIEVQPESEIEVQPESEIEVQPESEIEVQPESEIEVQPESEIEVQPDSEPKIEIPTKSPEPEVETLTKLPEPEVEIVPLSPKFEVETLPLSPKPEVDPLIKSPEPEIETLTKSLQPEVENLTKSPEPEVETLIKSPEPEVEIEIEIQTKSPEPNSMDQTEMLLQHDTQILLKSPEPTVDILTETLTKTTVPSADLIETESVTPSALVDEEMKSEALTVCPAKTPEPVFDNLQDCQFNLVEPQQDLPLLESEKQIIDVCLLPTTESELITSEISDLLQPREADVIQQNDTEVCKIREQIEVETAKLQESKEVVESSEQFLIDEIQNILDAAEPTVVPIESEAKSPETIEESLDSEKRDLDSPMEDITSSVKDDNSLTPEIIEEAKDISTEKEPIRDSFIPFNEPILTASNTNYAQVFNNFTLESETTIEKEVVCQISSTPNTTLSEQADTESITTAEINSFLERSNVPEVTSPLSPTEHPSQQVIDITLSGTPVSPTEDIIKTDLVAPEYPVETIITPSQEIVITPSEETKVEMLETTDEKEAPATLPEVASEAEPREKTNEAVVAAAVGTVAAAATTAAVAATIKEKKTTGKPLAKAQPSTKKPSKPGQSPTKTSTTKLTATKTLTATKSSVSSPTKPVPSKTTKAPMPKAAATQKPISKSSPKPKTETTATKTIEKKHTAMNGDVKQPAPIKRPSAGLTKTSVTAKSPVAPKPSPIKTEAKTTTSAPKVSAARSGLTSTATKSTTGIGATKTTIPASKPRPTSLSSKSTATTKLSSTVSTTKATVQSKVSTTASSPKSATAKPKPLTNLASKSPTTNAAPRPRLSLSKTKEPDTEKQIKESVNKQLTATSRTTTTKTSGTLSAGRTTTTVKKTETKSPSTRTTTTTKTTVTTLKSTTKKPTEITRIVAKKTGPTKTTSIKAQQNGLTNGVTTTIVQETTTILATEPQLIKDLSPIENKLILDNQLSETNVAD